MSEAFKLRFWEIRPEALEALGPWETLNKRRFLGAFGPMINFKRARAYKSVHNAKLRFLLTVKVSEALIQARLWKRGVQTPQVGAGAKRRRVLVLIHSGSVYNFGVCVLQSDSRLLSYISAGLKLNLIPILAATNSDGSKPLVSN
jgi:hypothetical protein